MRSRVAWLVIAAAAIAYAIRIGAPSWQQAGDRPPRYAYDEAYTAFTAHRILLGDPTVFEPAARRYVYLNAGASDLSPVSRGEWSHPPGGPLAIAATMSVLGFDELGARAAPLLAAVIALIATAYLAGPRRAWLACILVGFDGAFFVFARTALPHMLVVAGVTGGAALLVAAIATPRGRTWRTLAAGAAFGFAASVRWAAIPIAVAIGVAVAASAEGRRRRLPLIGAVGAAVAVYVASFTPYFVHGHGIVDLVRLHRDMLAFHTELPGRLGQSVPVYLWPWTPRAVTFLVESAHGEVHAVLCAGSRLLWWAIAPMLVYGARRARGRSARWLVPVCAIAATWLPWFAIGRFGMTYYLLPALPFTAVLASDAAMRVRAAPAVCAGVTLALFALLYPVLAAVPISRTTFDAYTAVLGG